MKILCVCSQGNKRSVYTRYILNHSHDVLALGVDVNTSETVTLLCEWAEIILIAEPFMRKKLPVKYHKKIDSKFTIGPDIYPVNVGGILKEIVYRKLKLLKYI